VVVAPLHGKPPMQRHVPNNPLRVPSAAQPAVLEQLDRGANQLPPAGAELVRRSPEDAHAKTSGASACAADGELSLRTALYFYDEDIFTA
jgi:hypothetical protein